MNELVDTYNELINNFKQLSVNEKKQKCIYEIKLLISSVKELATTIGIDTQTILSSEMNDISADNCIEDDYYEAMFAYINTLQILIGSYMENTINFYQPEEETEE